MTTHADFTEEEWEAVLEGPTSAGMIVTTAERGGSFREAFAMAKSYAEGAISPVEAGAIAEIEAALGMS